MYRIALRVEDLDLEDPETFSRLAADESLSPLGWMSVDGRVVAVLHIEDCDPVGQILQAARRITYAVPGARVREIAPDLVNISDIAGRLGISREAVRLWVKGERGPGDFPPPFDSVGGGDRGSMPVWQWSVVNAWLRRHFRLGDDEEYLTPEQENRANAALRQIEDAIDHEWKELVKVTVEVEVSSTPEGDRP